MRQGGEAALHPSHPEAVAHMEALHFFRLENFPATPCQVPSLPLYLPQIRFRRALHGHLDEGVYALRAEAIVGQRHVKTAAKVRTALGLRSDQKLVVLLFDRDDVIERLYRFPRKIVELAQAGFDLIVSASYSLWEPRPRLHNLRNLMRSLELCVVLQQEGAPAIPRVDWQIESDVHRWAKWLALNPSVQMVAIDAMTCATNGWNDVLDGMNMLDEMTMGRLHFVVNGPSVGQRWTELFEILPQGRLTLTEAGPIASPPTAQEQLEFAGPYAEILGPRFGARVRRKRAAINRLAAKAA